tara:strand:- start:862 stop:1797 length:936 start_codon:yes stop_codon:yes gene_type:complete
MAKKSRNNIVTTSFHYLVKTTRNEKDPQSPVETGFERHEFQRVVKRISDPAPLNDRDANVIERIKAGTDLPFGEHEVVDGYLHFGRFDGAYYGQQFRNNQLGIISADSLNLRPFHYLITHLRDGKILVGVTYHGQFGDYDGMSKCLMHILRGNYNIASRTLRSLSGEIGDGVPVEIKLTYRRPDDRPERQHLFGRSGVIAIKNTEFGDDFADQVGVVADRVRGDIRRRKQILADIVNNGELLELSDDDIIGCTAVVRENGRTRTIYLLGENNFATKFLLNVQVDVNGVPRQNEVRDEMIRVLRDKIMPMMN